MLITFSYGFLHALGPGHGKLFLTGYFCIKNSTVKYSILSGFMVGILHAASGVILVLILQLILHLPLAHNSDQLRDNMQIVSYSLLLIIGLLLFYKALAGQHSHHQTSWWGIILTIGLIPCPGAVMISIFGLTILDNVFLTLLLILSMGMGMSIAIALFASIPAAAQKFKLPFLKLKFFQKILPAAGALLIIILSIFFLINN